MRNAGAQVQHERCSAGAKIRRHPLQETIAMPEQPSSHTAGNDGIDRNSPAAF